jgi:hypothetical protein
MIRFEIEGILAISVSVLPFVLLGMAITVLKIKEYNDSKNISNKRGKRR